MTWKFCTLSTIEVSKIVLSSMLSALGYLLMWRKTMTIATLIKVFNWKLAYSYRALGHYHHGGEHDNMQAGRVLQQYLIIAFRSISCRHIHLQRQGPGRGFWNLKAHSQRHASPKTTSTMTRSHLLILLILKQVIN